MAPVLLSTRMTSVLKVLVFVGICALVNESQAVVCDDGRNLATCPPTLSAQGSGNRMLAQASSPGAAPATNPASSSAPINSNYAPLAQAEICFNTPNGRTCQGAANGGNNVGGIPYFPSRCDTALTQFGDNFGKLTSNCSEIGSERGLRSCLSKARSCARGGGTIDTEMSSNARSCGDAFEGIDDCPARAGQQYEGLNDEYTSLRDERRDLEQTAEELQDDVRDQRMDLLEKTQELQNDLNDRRKAQRQSVQDAMAQVRNLDSEKQKVLQNLRKAMRDMDKAYLQIDKELTQEQRRIRTERIAIIRRCEDQAFQNRDAVAQARQAYLQQTGQAVANSTAQRVTGKRNRNKKRFAQLIRECMYRSRNELAALDQDAVKALDNAKKIMEQVELDRAQAIQLAQELTQSLEGQKRQAAEDLQRQIQESEQELATAYQQGTARLQATQQNISQLEQRAQAKQAEAQQVKMREQGAQMLARCARPYSSDSTERLRAAREVSSNLTQVSTACQALVGCTNRPAACDDSSIQNATNNFLSGRGR